MNIIKTTTKSALHWHKRKMPANWDLNIYRGCSHRCAYCFARYSHSYLEDEEFFENVYVKTNIIENLKRELSSKKWQREAVNIGGVTDVYQKAEEKYKLVPQVIKTLVRYKTPFYLITKSNLIERDLDLIVAASKEVDVIIGSSICTFDKNLSSKLEPGAATPEKRLSFLRTLSQNNVHTTVLMMPGIPYITDTSSNIEEIFRRCKHAHIENIIPGLLNLKGNTKKIFLDFIRIEFPEYYKDIANLFKGSYLSRSYAEQFRQTCMALRKKYNYFNKYQEIPPPKIPTQLKLPF